MAADNTDGSHAERIGKQLDRCRERSLEELDLDTSTQPRVEVPELEQLAREYCDARGLNLHGRKAQIRRLLRDGLPVYAERGNEPESQLISRLFFDPSGADAQTRTRARQLLANEQQRQGLDRKRFGDLVNTELVNFAGFLIAFVAEIAAGKDESPAARDVQPELEPIVEPPPAPKRPLLLWIGAAVVTLVIIGAVLTAVVVTHNTGTSGQPSSPTARPTPTPTSPPFVAGKTYTEQEGGFGAPTFTDPHNPSVSGPKIPAFQKVEVACKVLSPTIPSVSPDGYWYHLSGDQWDGKYAAANTFQNGDPIGGPSQHNTDFSVPDCPS